MGAGHLSHTNGFMTTILQMKLVPYIKLVVGQMVPNAVLCHIVVIVKLGRLVLSLKNIIFIRLKSMVMQLGKKL